MTAYFVGGAVASAASATVYGAAGWTGVSVLGAAFAAAACLVWLVQSRPRRAVPAP